MRLPWKTQLWATPEYASCAELQPSELEPKNHNAMAGLLVLERDWVAWGGKA
jgi:hypothetical protein